MIEQIGNATAVENGEEATEKREGDRYPYEYKHFPMKFEKNRICLSFPRQIWNLFFGF